MPVRIYDISKKLGLENKEVLAKAKELGITAAKVASSSLDKITAEYLENELTGGKPVATATPTAPPPAPEPIIVVKSPPPVAATPPLIEVPKIKQPEEISTSVKAKPNHVEEEPPVESAQPAMAIAEPEPAEPAPPDPPPVPSGPQVGDKVGFIKLPSKPAPRAGEKMGSVKLPPSRPGAGGGRPDFSRGGGRGGDGRNLRGGGFPPGRQQPPSGGGTRPGFAPRPEAPKPAIPAAPKFVAPENGEVISLKPP
ncbi:MAG TPA: translation initiation factor IF-2 N-terminal domain-containing protein, partial [Verrucomicrobiae bacterium]|nr:translation initiation factor IF-2 N-terminal domain-containing protein [Verrucomicrobiae bacterium]